MQNFVQLQGGRIKRLKNRRGGPQAEKPECESCRPRGAMIKARRLRDLAEDNLQAIEVAVEQRTKHVGSACQPGCIKKRHQRGEVTPLNAAARNGDLCFVTGQQNPGNGDVSFYAGRGMVVWLRYQDGQIVSASAGPVPEEEEYHYY